MIITKEVSSMGKETLTPKQRLFCYEYVLDHNGKRSYQAAYPNCKAPGSAESQASRLLRNDKVKKFIADLEKRKLDKLDFTATDVLNALCSIGFAETAKPPNTSDRVKALAELLRHFELARWHEDEQTDDGFLEALEQKAGEQAWEE